MRFLLATSVAVAAMIATAAAAQDFSAQRLSDEIRVISADDFQGRKPGTEGEEKTLAFLQAQYEAMGLQPGGPDGQWRQRIELRRYTPAQGAAALSLTGADGQAYPLVLGTDAIVRAATNDGRADVSDAALVFAGFGVTAPERGWDDYGDVDVRGKVVVVVEGEPDGDLFNGAYTTHYQSAGYKADEAFRRGAVGLVILAGERGWARARGGADQQRILTPGAADLEFIATLDEAGKARLAQAAGVDPARLTGGQDGRFKAFELTGATLTARQSETIDTLVTHNLLARIEGSRRPDEVIVYSAHWDHIGVGGEHAGGEDTIFNGAWDNASGTIGVLEMARELSKAPRPERTIVFAHMAAEEMGLLGAYAYVADPVYPLETTVADINIDMLPLSGPTRDVPIFGKGQNTLEDGLDALARAEGRYVSDDGQPQQGFYYRSDHFPFARAGVPALMPWHGVDFVDGGKEAGWAAWRERFGRVYHQPSDEWSADWDLTSAVENLTLLYRLGLNLANGDEWPTWKPTSEFGQVRARSEAARSSR
ncbi:M28 family peptidase [uncultured Brevundimonas sp.]|uniref:M28 family peptidase n=1 Tax=uncultured Brevundimonas sp. TaxID=213418 RepID=UPI002594EC5A|nr:M28 family peptidase [uncultured Brevundimonas sp.]